MKVSDLISTRRKELGLTMEELGKIVGVGKGTISKWETGDISNMRRDKIALLAKALHVSPIDLIDPQEELRDPASQGAESTFTKDELQLVAAYRKATNENRQVVLHLLNALDKVPEDKQQILMRMIDAVLVGM